MFVLHMHTSPVTLNCSKEIPHQIPIKCYLTREKEWFRFFVVVTRAGNRSVVINVVVGFRRLKGGTVVSKAKNTK